MAVSFQLSAVRREGTRCLTQGLRDLFGMGCSFQDGNREQAGWDGGEGAKWLEEIPLPYYKTGNRAFCGIQPVVFQLNVVHMWWAAEILSVGGGGVEGSRSEGVGRGGGPGRQVGWRPPVARTGRSF